jgi:hypothetical protein
MNKSSKIWRDVLIKVWTEVDDTVGLEAEGKIRGGVENKVWREVGREVECKVRREVRGKVWRTEL